MCDLSVSDAQGCLSMSDGGTPTTHGADEIPQQLSILLDQVLYVDLLTLVTGESKTELDHSS